MNRVRVGFLLPGYARGSTSHIPRVMQLLSGLGVAVDVILPADGSVDLSTVRVEHDLYVLKKTSDFALSLAGALHVQNATIVNSYPATVALRDKIISSRILQSAGVPTPATYVASHRDRLAPLLAEGPLVVKPCQDGGRFSVRVVRSVAELADVPAGREAVFAQRYHAPQGRDLQDLLDWRPALRRQETLPCSPVTEMLDLGGGLRRALQECGEPACCELCDLLRELLGGDDRVVGLRRLKARVFRVEIANGIPWRSVVFKRLEPAIAQRNRLVAERWLPALGLHDRCARLLGAAAERRGDYVWHVCEDLGDETLAACLAPERIHATVDLIAELHTRAARHPVLPDVRRFSANLGQQYFSENVRDAVDALDALGASGIETPPQYAGLPNRLRDRLAALLADAPRRARVFEESAGPDTLLHGDLWTINVFVGATADGPRARLVDWDRLGVGPFSYDLSTFLFRLPPAARPEMLKHYQNAVAHAGWCVASPAELDVLFDSAERARYANLVIWPVQALLEERAAWGFPQLAEIERWFVALDSAPLGHFGPGRCDLG